MTSHRHNIRKITDRTINGWPVSKAAIHEENGYYQAIITDLYGREYVSGSNNTTLASERAELRSMLDARK